MKKQLLNLALLLLLLPQAGFSQLSISGEITPNAMFRISDATLIDLPFRLGNISLNYAWGDFEVVSNTALETRWKNAEYDSDMFQFREAYLMWYPSFGEIKLGKMIQAWGAADANNPTDNLSPYDFYYMFLVGTDRKLGNLGLSAKTYYEDWQLEGIFTPEHEATRLPFGEPDFPISFPFEPESYVDIEAPAEYGFRLQRAFDVADVSVSYLKAHDQLFSMLYLEMLNLNNAIPHFGYRNTDVLGLDFVAFPGNWTLRGEGGYFKSATPEFDASLYSLGTAISYPVDAEYFQYVLQVEYQFANQVSLMAQFLGTEVTQAEGYAFPVGSMGQIMLTEDNLVPGLGTPFAMISKQVVMFSSMATLFDNSLELSGMEMINLEETGSMTSLGISYSMMEGLNLEATLAIFIGGDEEGNSFKDLEDFSNVSLGLTYNF